jgi:histidyl-tRNA synthetase
MAFQAPRGLKDHLGDEALLFAQMAATASEVFGRFGYKLIATPMFEAADVFIRGLGEATDVVGKEMFEVYSPLGVAKLQSGAQLLADERFILRPEGTAGVARAVVEHGLMPPGAPVAKLWYHGPMFRSERPQKGRLRQFHQIGVECLGAADASIDAEVILMLMRFFEALGLP